LGLTLQFTHPERLLRSFGIEHPRDIDLEAIAWELGAKIRKGPMRTCEARIVGRNGRAIITVDEKRPARRRRFSVAHELGHWQHHRGKCLTCRTADIGSINPRRANDPERVADEYASDLILPRYLMEPLLKDVPRLTIKSLGDVADEFQASKTATLIKIVATGRYPILMVSTTRAGRKWFRKYPCVPERWFPRSDVSPDSLAFEMLYGDKPESSVPRPIKASAWFDRDTGGYSILEQSFKIADTQVMSILTLNDKKMLAD
jgi:hypothetical protein